MRFILTIGLFLFTGCATNSGTDRQPSSELKGEESEQEAAAAPVSALDCRHLDKKRIVIEKKDNNDGYVSGGRVMITRLNPPTLFLKYVQPDGTTLLLGHILEDEKPSTELLIRDRLAVMEASTVPSSWFKEYGFMDNCANVKAGLEQPAESIKQMYWCWQPDVRAWVLADKQKANRICRKMNPYQGPPPPLTY